MFNPGHHSHPIVIDDNDDDDDMQMEYPPQHGTEYGIGHPPNISASVEMLRPAFPDYDSAAIAEEKKVRSRLREERHAALSVLMDRELLTIQALANQETLPQARRRFLAKLMAPEDLDVAAAIRADRFIILHPPSSSSSSSSSTPMIVSRRIVDVHETDDAGWRRPESGAGVSAASSSRTRGKLAPDRARKAKVSSSRQQQQRERERRRRWSGAEREDIGDSPMERSP